MGEDEPKQSAPPNGVQRPMLCEECKTNPSKYTCPGCSLRSCSLPCVNSHKKRTACTGKRPVTSFVPISQFDDNLLISDYNMLENVKRIADSAQRMRVKLCGDSHFKVPYPIRYLRNAAASRRTKMLFLSSGMSKRVKNRTFYNNKKKFISWTIEWRFHSTDVVLVDHGVHENTNLSSVIENHLKPGPWNNSLKQFCDETLDSLKFFIRKYPKGSRSPYRQLNIRVPIREQLANMVILEYPTIHVYLPSHTYDFDVINDVTTRKQEINEPAHHDNPIAEGVTFKEEEVEDGESLDPLVLDLMNHDGQRELVQNLPDVQLKRARLGLESDTCVNTIEDKNIGNKSCVEQINETNDFDFDFEPDLIDLCPDLTDTNTNSHFDFDGELAKQWDLEGGIFLNEEELEEGEIVF